MKIIKREDLIDRLSKASGFYKKDLKVVLKALDDVIYDCFDEITPEEAVQIQLLSGLKLQGKYVPERHRVDPRDQSPIVCEPCVKPQAVFSLFFRDAINNQILEKQKDD